MFLDYLMDVLVMSLQIDKKLEKFKVSDQLGWIADYFLIVREERFYCQKGHKVKSYFEYYQFILIEGEFEESLNKFLKDQEVKISERCKCRIPCKTFYKEKEITELP
jgi:hypothetical protein